jgi:hypothetical protein
LVTCVLRGEGGGSVERERDDVWVDMTRKRIKKKKTKGDWTGLN